MEKTPELSVVIAAYNHGAYIGETIRSVLRQKYQDFEVIVLDDGSTDNTKDVVGSFADPRIRYVYQENSGLPACGRNRGMALARGRYIALLDGDDYWHEDKLKRCKAVLDTMPEIGLVCHNAAIVHDGKVTRTTSYMPYRDRMYERLLFGGNCLHVSGVVLRREIFFDDNFRFSEDKGLFTVEDYEYWLRLSKRCRFHLIDDVLGYYRVTATGAFLRNTEANTGNMLRLLEAQCQMLDHHDRSLMRKVRIRKSTVMCAAGRMYHHQKEFAAARRWYARALREYPANYKALVGLIAASIGIRILYS